MPHLIVDYSANLDDFPTDTVLRELNASLCASGEIADEADLKSRAVAHTAIAIGTGAGPRGFVHAELRLLTGRSPETKAALSARIADVLRRHTPKPAGMLVQISVEVRDMDRPSYAKERLQNAG